MSNADNEELAIAVALTLMSGARRAQIVAQALSQGSFVSIAGHVSVAERRMALRALEDSHTQDLWIVPLFSSDYPATLRVIDTPPPVLFVRSQRPAPLRQCSCIGVVGTRAASVDMCQMASEMARDLALAGCAIVSGLALGIDGAAHRGALLASVECPTCAVLAHGLDRVYPPSHQALARQIVDRGGCLISEYPPGTEPMKHHFLARNRIIAGLSRGIIVVEAGERSGSLVTAQFAADYGRDVFVLTSRSSNARNAGGISMIEQGAQAIYSAADVLHEYGIVAPTHQFGGTWTEVDANEFVKAHGYSHAQLLELEISGEVVRLSGNRVRVHESHVRVTKLH